MVPLFFSLKCLDSAKYKVFYLSDSKLTPRHFFKGLLD